MTEIFVFGTLCHAPVLRIVAGDVVVAKAELPDAAVMAARGGRAGLSWSRPRAKGSTVW